MQPLTDVQSPTFSFDLDPDYVHYLLCGALWGKGKEMSSVQTVNGSEEEFALKRSLVRATRTSFLQDMMVGLWVMRPALLLTSQVRRQRGLLRKLSNK